MRWPVATIMPLLPLQRGFFHSQCLNAEQMNSLMFRSVSFSIEVLFPFSMLERRTDEQLDVQKRFILNIKMQNR